MAPTARPVLSVLPTLCPDTLSQSLRLSAGTEQSPCLGQQAQNRAHPNAVHLHCTKPLLAQGSSCPRRSGHRGSVPFCVLYRCRCAASPRTHRSITAGVAERCSAPSGGRRCSCPRRSGHRGSVPCCVLSQCRCAASPRTHRSISAGLAERCSAPLCSAPCVWLSRLSHTYGRASVDPGSLLSETVRTPWERPFLCFVPMTVSCRSTNAKKYAHAPRQQVVAHR